MKMISIIMMIMMIFQECPRSYGYGGQLAGGAEAADPGGDREPQRRRDVYDDIPITVPQR